MSPLRARTREPDQVCADASELARGAAVEAAGPGQVGEYLGAEPEAERIVTHLFQCLAPAYQGWRWAVTVSRASRSKAATVSESLLLPGPDAVLAPPWVPWRDRLRPGDLGVGDLLPAPADDERLVPMAILEGDDGAPDWQDASAAAADVTAPGPDELAVPDSAGETGLSPEPAPPAGRRSRRGGGRVGAWDAAPGRARVLSPVGRDEAALRWYASEHGPDSPLARAAPAPCVSCGFFLPVTGPLGRVFGVCSNEYAPDDGRVVSVDHGCGAHSEALLPPGSEPPVSPVIDELGYDLVDVPGVSVEETVFEPIEHG